MNDDILGGRLTVVANRRREVPMEVGVDGLLMLGVMGVPTIGLGVSDDLDIVRTIGAGLVGVETEAVLIRGTGELDGLLCNDNEESLNSHSD